MWYAICNLAPPIVPLAHKKTPGLGKRCLLHVIIGLVELIVLMCFLNIFIILL